MSTKESGGALGSIPERLRDLFKQHSLSDGSWDYFIECKSLAEAVATRASVAPKCACDTFLKPLVVRVEKLC